MTEVAIRVENLSKQYRIGQRKVYRTLRDTLTDAIFAPFRRLPSLFGNSQSAIRNPQSDDTIWALKDVSFEIKRGDIVGIIGRNGSGKSTLLKILSGITEPTEGTAEIHGRVGSLLEVGTGFHAELTGRENIYLNAAILGMKKAEIARKFDEIVAFAEVEKFIDTPVKHYSSGMHVRLAFAVAAHLEPEILLVDEVLAVGDIAFQKKCLGKMENVAKEGRTVLFVSHNTAALRQLCQTGILLHSGAVRSRGAILDCLDEYLQNGSDLLGSILAHIRYINSAVKIESVIVNGSSRDQLSLSAHSRMLKIEMVGRVSRPMRLELEARIYDLYEAPLAFFSPGHERGFTDLHPEGCFRLVRCMELPRMMRGDYYLHLYLTDPGTTGWVEIPRAVRLIAEGAQTATGHVFDYYKGAGWILLYDLTGRPGRSNDQEGVRGDDEL